MPVGFGALTLLFTYPLLFEMGRSLPNDLHDPLLNAWILAWDADRIRHGFQGLWDAPNFFPYSHTLTYSEHLLGIALFTAPVQWLSGNPLIAFNAAFLASFVVSGCGMYLLTFRLFGNTYAAAVAGVAFAFLPYRASQLSHLQVLMCGWMPFALYALHRYFSVKSYFALAGFVAASLLQVLSNLYYVYFLPLPVIVVTAVELTRKQQDRLRTGVEIGLASLIILLVFSPIGMVYYNANSDGLARSRGEIVNYSADISSYVHADQRLVVWGNVLPAGKQEAQLFPGAVLVVLAAAGVVAGLRRRGRLIKSIGPSARRHAHTYLGITLLALLFSLGPEPKAWGHSFWPGGPYEWLLAFLPGLDGVRAPGRFAMVAYLGLSVLAALGVALIVGGLSRRTATVVSIGLCCATVVEGISSPLQVARFPADLKSNRGLAYEWLRRSPPGAILELPLWNTTDNCLYQFATLEHGHRLVNGYSGYTAALFAFLRGPASPLFEYERYGEFLKALRAIGVRYVVIHSERFDRHRDAVRTLEAVRSNSTQIFANTTFGDTSVFWLSPWEKPVAIPGTILRQIPAAAFDASSSHQHQRLAQGFDGDSETKWHTGVRQNGDESIEIRFRHSHDVGRLVFVQTLRSLGDYPRELVVEASSNGQVYRELYRGGVIRQLLGGLVSEGYPVPIVIELPNNNTRSLRIRQTGQTRTWHWAVDDLSLWER